MCFWYFVELSRWKEFHLLQQMEQNWILSGESIQLDHFPSCEISQLNRKINRRRNITFVQQTLGMTMMRMIWIVIEMTTRIMMTSVKSDRRWCSGDDGLQYMNMMMAEMKMWPSDEKVFAHHSQRLPLPQ